MESLEDIFVLIKKIFDKSLKISINVPDDLGDGRLFLELLKKRANVNIPNSKEMIYEKIECILDEFYEYQTNIVIDYVDLLENVKDEYIIILSILCFVYYWNHKEVPSYLTQDESKLLCFLTAPARIRKPPLPDSFRLLIEKAKKRDFDDSSISGLPINSSSATDSFRKHEIERNGSEDEVSTFSNVPSFISDTSFHSRDHSKRPHKVIFRANQYLSPKNRCSKNSPKLNDSRKLEQKRIKAMESQNYEYRIEIAQLQEDINKHLETELKQNNEITKLKIENRKFFDENDCLKSNLEGISAISIRKDKELEKIRKESESNKKLVGESSDKIKQLELSNNKLRQDIHELNIRIKNKDSQYEESFQNKIDMRDQNRTLQNENERLKYEIIELQKQIEDNQKVKTHKLDYETILETPTINIDEGESLDIINQMKFAEMEENLNRQLTDHRKEIDNLKSLLVQEKQNSNNYQIKLVESNEEIKSLKENHHQLDSKVVNLNSMEEKLTAESNVENILNYLQSLFYDKSFSNKDRNLLFKSTAGLLEIDLKSLESNHDECQIEISELYTKLKNCEDELEQVNENKDETERLLYEKQIEVSNLQMEYENLQCILQNHKAKSHSTEFKLKQTLCAVSDERNEANMKLKSLNTNLWTCENDLKKSNQDFNTMRTDYYRCLDHLRRLSKDCDDYEKIIIEVTENQKKVFKNVSCQTENSIGFSSGVNNNLGQKDFLREMAFERRNIESANSKRNNDLYINLNLPHNSTNPAVYKEFDQYQTPTNEKRSNYNQVKVGVKSSSRKPRVERINNLEMGNSYEDIDYGFCKVTDPRWTNIDQCNLANSMRKPMPNEVKKVDSPAVKPDRLHQMISRNLQQPEHLKTSYPIETQTLEEGYLADCLMKEINITNEELIDTDRPDNTARSTSLRHVSRIDPMNLRSHIPNRGMFGYTENTFADEFLKASKSNQMMSGDLVLSARSNNNLSTPRTEVFKVPDVPKKPPVNPFHLNLVDNDRENVAPFGDLKPYCNDKESESSILSYRFDIVNSPAKKKRRNPKGYLHKNKKNFNESLK